jgi:ABC-type transport system substrate-binding protein
MTRTDTAVVGTLVVLLAIVAGLIGVPALQPQPSPSAVGAVPSSSPEASATPTGPHPYREGVLGRPVSVSPLTAETQVDRDLVALVFSGLVRNGADGRVVPDLARDWSVDADGSIWTVTLRDDARWQDDTPVTAGDVVYTIHTLQDPAYAGPAASSWDGVTVRAISDKVVSFTLKTPLAGFLQALTQPIAPAHLLADVPVSRLPDDAFGQHPVGSGPFSLVDLDGAKATLVPAPASTTAGLDGVELHFYADPQRLAEDYRSGQLDGVSGLDATQAADLGTTSGSQVFRYPGSTLTAVLLNLRPTHPEFASAAVRSALLQAIDVPAIASSAYGMSAVVATDPIPPSSPLFDAKADPPVAFSKKGATAALKKADWTKKADGWYLPKAKQPLTIEIISPTAAANPGLFAAAEAVAADWTALGLTVTHSALPPGMFVSERLARGDFQVAVADLAIGLDPDLYPLLASSQTVTGGSNIIGLQDSKLDKLLEAARAPATDADHTAAYQALQTQLGKGRYLLPLVFADEVVVARDTLQGPVVRQVADPSDRFWDVLTWRLADDP